MSSSEPPSYPFDDGWQVHLPQADEDISERGRELRRLAAASRRVIEELMSTSAPREAVQRASELVESVAELLAAQPHGRDDEHVGESSVAGDPVGFLEFSPLIGRANPIAPPLEPRLVDGRVVATAVFGSAYEGPPGHVHGGYIAAAFDEVLGMVQSTTKRPGMTGMLTIRYRSPTPLHEVLVFAGEVVKVEGRKILTRGTLRAGDDVCAEAEGLFISIDFERFAALGSRRERPD